MATDNKNKYFHRDPFTDVGVISTAMEEQKWEICDEINWKPGGKLNDSYDNSTVVL